MLGTSKQRPGIDARSLPCYVPLDVFPILTQLVVSESQLTLATSLSASESFCPARFSTRGQVENWHIAPAQTRRSVGSSPTLVTSSEVASTRLVSLGAGPGAGLENPWSFGAGVRSFRQPLRAVVEQLAGSPDCKSGPTGRVGSSPTGGTWRVNRPRGRDRLLSASVATRLWFESTAFRFEIFHHG